MYVNQEVTIDFTDDKNDDRILAWLKECGLEADSLSDLTFNTKVQVEISDLDEDDIIAAYDKLNKLDNSDLYHLGEAYRRMAEGNLDEAMEPSISTTSFCLHGTDPGAPGHFTPDGDADEDYIVMPMRVS